VSLCTMLAGVLYSASIASAASGPLVEEESISEVTATSAKLQARINPEGSDTTYHFEYGPTASYGSSLATGDAGSEVAGVVVSVKVQGLQPHTTYHVSVVAGNEVEKEVAGVDHSFTTQQPGGALVLPDGRQWEMVSPPQKLGSQTLPTRDAVMQASEDGSAMTYYLTNAFVDEPEGNALLSQALSARSANGWGAQDIAPPHKLSVSPTNGGAQSEDVFFSTDLASALRQPQVGGGESEKGEVNLYIRNNVTGAYMSLLTSSNVLSETHLFGESLSLKFIAGTPDLSYVIFSSPQRLTEEGPIVSFHSYYYEWSSRTGNLKLINESSENSQIGLSEPGKNNERNVISNEGSRVVLWSKEGAEYALYTKNMITGESVRINSAQGITEPPLPSNRPTFQGASSDGSKVFFTDDVQLTTVPGAGLYVYDVNTGKLTLITVAEKNGETVGVYGIVLGNSEDGSYTYLVTGSVLNGHDENAKGEVAIEGANNLYELHDEGSGGVIEWKTSFIATLANDDRPDWAESSSNPGGTVVALSARVSPNGRHLAFMSDRSLTGYDNLDVSSRQPDEEVYTYDAQSGRLVCASCNPSGALPGGHIAAGQGENTFSAPDLNGTWYTHWIAGSVPDWIAFYGGEQAVYQPRYLSDSGRVFFDSSDGLVPQDANGTEDVYEYEPEGLGDCTGADTTYDPKSEGCISLISGGTGEAESVFADASTNGNDVFFVTAERLGGSDVDQADDMYDAHVCSTEAPCFPAEAVTPPPCETADGCKAAPTPQPAIFGSPASATFSGAGNVTPASNQVSAKAKKRAKKPKKKKSVGKRRVKRAKRSSAKHAEKRAGRSRENASKRGTK
jgi:hypothetical protein